MPIFLSRLQFRLFNFLNFQKTASKNSNYFIFSKCVHFQLDDVCQYSVRMVCENLNMACFESLFNIFKKSTFTIFIKIMQNLYQFQSKT